MQNDGSSGFLKSLLSCYWGADMSEDESNHPSSSPLPDTSHRPNMSRSTSCSAALNCSDRNGSDLNCSDRTVVHNMGDTVSGFIRRTTLRACLMHWRCHWKKLHVLLDSYSHLSLVSAESVDTFWQRMLDEMPVKAQPDQGKISRKMRA